MEKSKVEPAYERRVWWSRLIPVKVFWTRNPHRDCPVCHSRLEELRYIDPNDCGGCETCGGLFSGTWICSNLSCEVRRRTLEAFVPDRPTEGEQPLETGCAVAPFITDPLEDVLVVPGEDW